MTSLTSLFRKKVKPSFHNGLKFSPSGSILIADKWETKEDKKEKVKSSDKKTDKK
ncbi:hypothetical protein [Halobacteriovorax sp. CON-3]|uniref:hypothetical protein n=1 Tax=Halobacteriovorax sp. CON-3 TaxID=3157710 RepID=UPI003723187C